MFIIDADVKIFDLRTEDDSGQINIGLESPRLSWRLMSSKKNVKQISYEIEVADDINFSVNITTSKEVQSKLPFLAPWPGDPLKSREVKFWRVRVKTNAGWTVWSNPSRIEASLLSSDDWIAKPITNPKNIGISERTPAQLLRRI